MVRISKLSAAACVGRRICILGTPGLNSWEDLKGKRLGMLSRGSCPEWFVRAMLVARGLNPDHHLVWVGLLDEYPRIIEVMKEGRIDAGIMVEPNMAIGEEDGVINCWGAVYDEPSLPPFQWIIHVARPDFIEREPEVVRAVLRACRRSAHYAAEHVDEWVEFGTRQYGVAPLSCGVPSSENFRTCISTGSSILKAWTR